MTVGCPPDPENWLWAKKTSGGEGFSPRFSLSRKRAHEPWLPLSLFHFFLQVWSLQALAAPFPHPVGQKTSIPKPLHGSAQIPTHLPSEVFCPLPSCSLKLLTSERIPSLGGWCGLGVPSPTRAWRQSSSESPWNFCCQLPQLRHPQA